MATTFKAKKKEKIAFISWLAVKSEIPVEFQNPFCDEFLGSYWYIRIDKIFIMFAVKYGLVNNDKGTNLYF